METTSQTKQITNEDFKRGAPVRAESDDTKEEKKVPVLRQKKFFFTQQGITIEAANLSEATKKLKETYKSNNTTN